MSDAVEDVDFAAEEDMVQQDGDSQSTDELEASGQEAELPSETPVDESTQGEISQDVSQDDATQDTQDDTSVADLQVSETEEAIADEPEQPDEQKSKNQEQSIDTSVSDNDKKKEVTLEDAAASSEDVQASGEVDQLDAEDVSEDDVGADEEQEATEDASQEMIAEDAALDAQDEQQDMELLQATEHEAADLAAIPSEEDEMYGIDTFDLQDPAGNWLYKRIWWEKAEARYDKIKGAVSRVLDGRMYFFERRVDLDRSLFDPFYNAIGFSRGELFEAVALLIDQLQESLAKKDNKQDEKKVAKESILLKLEQERENIERLQKEVEGINNIDRTIDDALTKLMNQINMCRQYEQEAWQYLRSISREVSDKAARDHYYAMDTMWKNVKNIQRYVEGEFAQHFNALAKDAQQKTEAVQQSLAQLREKGIDLKKIAEKALKPAPEKEKVQSQEEEETEPEEEPVGWIRWFADILLWPFYKIMGVWHSMFG